MSGSSSDSVDQKFMAQFASNVYFENHHEDSSPHDAAKQAIIHLPVDLLVRLNYSPVPKIQQKLRRNGKKTARPSVS
ncbi:MAG TPA: hypothetical protein DCR17_03925 [Verrucomicrobiales bacterium]|nr:hypothetical protein [Verrucomicrobiales bacterium]HBP54903.1 hypothetical protein [Verrucomicrobiales bacterium]